MSHASEFAVERPLGSNSGTQCWRSLLFCHWRVSVDAIRHLIPVGLEIDTFDATAWVGVVPFKMRSIRPRWLPRTMSLDFLETNVRTYVTYQGRPGVYFFSLDANSRLAVVAARLGWALPYFHAKMYASCEGDRHRYRSQRRGTQGHLDVAFRVDQELGPSSPGTLEHFLLERYFLFVQRGGSIRVGQVFHQPYHAHTATIDEFDESLVSAAGISSTNRPPELAHYARGVDVEVFGIR